MSLQGHEIGQHIHANEETVVKRMGIRRSQEEKDLLDQYGLQGIQFCFTLTNIADIHQYGRKENPVHLILHIGRIRVRPDQDGGILGRRW